MGTLRARGFCLQESDLVGADPLPCPLLCPDLGLPLFASTSRTQYPNPESHTYSVSLNPGPWKCP